MKKQNFTVSAFWDKKALKEDGTSRILITINLNRQQFRVSVKLYATQEDFKKALQAKGGTDSQRELRREIFRYVDKAETILGKMPNPTKESFLRLFKSESNLPFSDKTPVYPLMEAKRDQMVKDKRFGSAMTIRCSWYSLKDFREKLFFEDLDGQFLNSYKRHMKEKGCSDATIGIYLRELKTIYNQLVRDGVLTSNKNPFAEVKIGGSKKSVNVLYPNQLKALWEFQPEGILQDRAKDFFFFCYLCNGMNFADMASLKFRNISGDILSFIRRKTRNTRRDTKVIKVFLLPEAKAIIEKCANAGDIDHLTPVEVDHLWPE
ncbi:MAG: hypothetical protein EOP49_06135 [Sphingobacteriales bacterium]|nr:MAG: hypothetical protein EOP49_06135 [Sphingobacteriales bacterium]